MEKEAKRKTQKEKEPPQNTKAGYIHELQTVLGESGEGTEQVFFLHVHTAGDCTLQVCLTSRNTGLCEGAAQIVCKGKVTICYWAITP